MSNKKYFLKSISVAFFLNTVVGNGSEVVVKYSYPSHRIEEIVKAPKVLRENEVFETSHKGNRGAGFQVALDLKEGSFTDLLYLGKAHDLTVVEGYDATLILAAQRIRGVGFSPVSRRRFYKESIPAGWHQNIINPNLLTSHADSNRHEVLNDFNPIDFKDFIQKTAQLWNIELELEGELF